ILGVEKQLGTIAPGKAAHLIVTDGDFQEEKTFVRYVFADGVRFEYEKTQVASRPGFPRRPTDDAAKPDDSKKPDDAKKPDDPKKPDDAKKPDDKKAETTKVEQPTEIEADRKPKQRTHGNVLIRGATVLTVTNGTYPKTDILVQDGKIAKIGQGITA